MEKSFRIGIVQQKSTPFAVKQNTHSALQMIKEAASNRADLVLFPECFLTGYAFPEVDETLPFLVLQTSPAYQSWKAQALSLTDDTFQTIRHAAKTHRIGVLITALTKGTERPHNTAMLIDKNGEIQFVYHKVHTCAFSFEKMIEPGNEFFVGEIDGVKIGAMICYDREYPESARILMLKGAELIVVPNDCTIMAPRLRALCVRAYENMVGIIMANPPGAGAGCSCAYSPIQWKDDTNAVDPTLCLASETEEGILYADYDLDALHAYRENEMMGNTFRRPDVYAPLLSTEISPPFLREH